MNAAGAPPGGRSAAAPRPGRPGRVRERVENGPHADLCNWLAAVLDEVPHITNRQVADRMCAIGRPMDAQKTARALKRMPSRELVATVIELRVEACGGDTARSHELWGTCERLVQVARETAAAATRRPTPSASWMAPPAPTVSRDTRRIGGPGPGGGMPLAVRQQLAAGKAFEAKFNAVDTELKTAHRERDEARQLLATAEDRHRAAVSTLRADLTRAGRQLEKLERENSTLRLQSLASGVEGIEPEEVDREAALTEAQKIRQASEKELDLARALRDKAERQANLIVADARRRALALTDEAEELKLNTLREIRELNVELEILRGERHVGAVPADAAAIEPPLAGDEPAVSLRRSEEAETHQPPPADPDAPNTATPLFDGLRQRYERDGRLTVEDWLPHEPQFSDAPSRTPFNPYEYDDWYTARYSDSYDAEPPYGAYESWDYDPYAAPPDETYRGDEYSGAVRGGPRHRRR